MTIREVLKSANISINEAEILLANIINKDKSWIIAHSNEPISNNHHIKFNKWTSRRENNEPIAYIIGKKEFYERDFYVDKNVLIPRPTTEYLIDAVTDFLNHREKEKYEADTEIIIHSQRYLDDNPEFIVDIGTGSGCIAITLALKHPKLKIIATDLSMDALDVAKRNIDKYDLKSRIEVRRGDLLDAIIGLDKPFLLVLNPPYIPDEEELMKDVVNFEPKLALRGGKDGGNLVRKSINQAKVHKYCVGTCIELREDQIKTLKT